LALLSKSVIISGRKSAPNPPMHQKRGCPLKANELFKYRKTFKGSNRVENGDYG